MLIFKQLLGVILFFGLIYIWVKFLVELADYSMNQRYIGFAEHLTLNLLITSVFFCLEFLNIGYLILAGKI